MLKYKIVEVKDNGIRFIYHGLNGKKTIKKNVWMQAKEVMTKDGSSYPYLSGFHFFDTWEIADFYLKRFKKKDNKKIVEVKVRNIRRKGPNTKVKLARFIKFV